MSPPAGSTDPLVGDPRRAGLLAAELAPRLDRIARAIRALRVEVLDAG